RNTNTMTVTSLLKSSHERDTGRTRRYRSVPALASPAIVSPAITAVATGRKIGRISASAAAGNRVPLLSTSVNSAGPWPGRGPTPVVRRKMPTMTGRPDSKATVSHVRGRVNSLPSSTPSIAAPSGQAEVGVLEAAPLHHQLAHAHAGVDERVVEILGPVPVERHPHPLAVALDRATAEAEHGHDGIDVGRVDHQ